MTVEAFVCVCVCMFTYAGNEMELARTTFRYLFERPNAVTPLFVDTAV